jgi:catechol 2,3-dioxygenase-like lactoylglutathione lyase family enzyme
MAVSVLPTSLVLGALLIAAPVRAEQPVESLLQKGVTVTCRLEETIAFYRDILNQHVLEDSVRDGARVALFVDIPPSAKVRLVTMGGSGVYPWSETVGGHLSFIGVADPQAEACRTQFPEHGAPRRAKAGDVLFSVRVANLDEIAARVAKAGAAVLVPPGPSGSGLARNMMMLDPNGRIVEVFETPHPPR